MTVDKKIILRDVLNCPDRESLINILPDCSEQDINKIFTLKQRLQEEKLVEKQMQETSRTLSRKIGIAKKQGDSTDELMSEMRTVSSELKRINEKLQASEEAIISLFPSETSKNKNQDHRSDRPVTKRYTELEYHQDIYVTLLQDDTKAWNKYVENNPATSIYHLAEWRDVIRKSFGHEAYYFYAHDKSGTIIGVLPLIRLKSRLFGDFMVSMPYFNYGGAIGNHPTIEKELVRQANNMAAELGLDHIEYRDEISIPDLPERTNKVNMILALPADADTLWQSFSPKLRSQIKRPQREDIQVKLGGVDLLDDFYSVFARNMRDLGTPVYSKAFFENIISTFTKKAHILIITLSGKPVAGAFLIGYKETLEIPWASTIRNVNHLSINMLMYWEILSFAIREEYAYFDFGRSSIDSGTYRFKKQWGAQPRQLYWHYWLNNRELPSLNPSNPKFRLIINIWKNLPIWLTKLIGPIVVKNLP